MAEHPNNQPQNNEPKSIETLPKCTLTYLDHALAGVFSREGEPDVNYEIVMRHATFIGLVVTGNVHPATSSRAALDYSRTNDRVNLRSVFSTLVLEMYPELLVLFQNGVSDYTRMLDPIEWIIFKGPKGTSREGLKKGIPPYVETIHYAVGKVTSGEMQKYFIGVGLEQPAHYTGICLTTYSHFSPLTPEIARSSTGVRNDDLHFFETLMLNPQLHLENLGAVPVRRGKRQPTPRET